MPAIFEQQWLILASLSRAWPAPTTLNLMAVTPERGNDRARVIYCELPNANFIRHINAD